MVIAFVNLAAAGILTGLALYFFSQGDIGVGCFNAAFAVVSFGWGILVGIHNIFVSRKNGEVS